MRTQPPMVLQVIIAALLLVTANSCLKDKCSHTYTLYRPVYKSLTQVRAEMTNSAVRDVKHPGKLYIYGNYIFLNELTAGIHIIDNTQPANPKNIGFVQIPGNVDLAVKGNTLYADSYADLMTFDISNPLKVVSKKLVENVFPDRRVYYSNTTNPDSIMIVVDWVEKDTTLPCEDYNRLYVDYYSLASSDKSGNYASPGMGGKGGSMARFTIFNNYLYTVTSSDLNIFDISSPQNPSFKNKSSIGSFGIETIYPFQDKLFIGSTDGMYIYDASNAGTPVKVGQFTHVRSCDPVVADDKYAWVTLRSGTTCQGFTNQLEVVNISSLSNPSLVKTYSMTNPHGLAKDGDLLFICDGKDGLKIYNAADANNLQLIKHISNMTTYDVIAWANKALVVAKDGLYQFDYSDVTNIKLLSKINISE